MEVVVVKTCTSREDQYLFLLRAQSRPPCCNTPEQTRLVKADTPGVIRSGLVWSDRRQNRGPVAAPGLSRRYSSACAVDFSLVLSRFPAWICGTGPWLYFGLPCVIVRCLSLRVSERTAHVFARSLHNGQKERVQDVFLVYLSASPSHVRNSVCLTLVPFVPPDHQSLLLVVEEVTCSGCRVATLLVGASHHALDRRLSTHQTNTAHSALTRPQFEAIDSRLRSGLNQALYHSIRRVFRLVSHGAIRVQYTTCAQTIAN